MDSCFKTKRLFSDCLLARRFTGLAAQGKSPTEELLADWGTTNCTVGELVNILNSNKLLAAVTLLLPGMTLINQLWFIRYNIQI